MERERLHEKAEETRRGQRRGKLLEQLRMLQVWARVPFGGGAFSCRLSWLVVVGCPRNL